MYVLGDLFSNSISNNFFRIDNILCKLIYIFDCIGIEFKNLWYVTTNCIQIFFWVDVPAFEVTKKVSMKNNDWYIYSVTCDQLSNNFCSDLDYLVCGAVVLPYPTFFSAVSKLIIQILLSFLADTPFGFSAWAALTIISSKSRSPI